MQDAELDMKKNQTKISKRHCKHGLLMNTTIFRVYGEEDFPDQLLKKFVELRKTTF